MNTTEDRVANLLARLADYARVDTLDALGAVTLVATPPPAGAKRRRYALAVVTLAVIVLAGTLIVVRSDHQSPRVSTSGGGLMAGTTTTLPKAPIAAREDAAGVWTGTELLIWGGDNANSAFADGSSYDPESRRWELMAPAPLSARADMAAVWTGSELVVWGGADNGSVRSDGAAYNPATRRWRMIAPSPIPGLERPATVWTGSEMIVVGGIDAPGPGGAAYNPTTNTWRTIAAPPGDQLGPYPQAAWTGTKALFVLSLDVTATPALTPPLGPGTGTPTIRRTSSVPSGPPPTRGPGASPASPDSNLTLASYDPTTDAWTIVAGPAIRAGTDPWLVWAGSEALLLSPFANSQDLAYEPSTRAWRTVPAPPASVAAGSLNDALIGATYPAWDGRQVLFWWGGPIGLAYDPSGDSWQAFDAGSSQARDDATVVWTGNTLLGWGGFTPGKPVLHADGAAFRPA